MLWKIYLKLQVQCRYIGGATYLLGHLFLIEINIVVDGSKGYAGFYAEEFIGVFEVAIYFKGKGRSKAVVPFIMVAQELILKNGGCIPGSMIASLKKWGIDKGIGFEVSIL